MRGTYKGRAVGVDGSGYVLVVDVGYDEGDVHVPVNATTYAAFGGIRTGVRVDITERNNSPFFVVSVADD